MYFLEQFKNLLSVLSGYTCTKAGLKSFFKINTGLMRKTSTLHKNSLIKTALTKYIEEIPIDGMMELVI
ncbi:hypothetical protein [Bacillus yapensis]|uniref:hypothetical protein n=1 Tax=Bacillus yapensis TaxID=2492960 RepID=UPI0014855A38|nr:hypothetical protein [Bacillus yapensis]